MTIHSIDENVLNSNIVYCINEYVRPIKHREILYKHWFEQATIGGLSAEYHLSDTAIKKILYDIGDKILLKASKM